MPNPTLLDILFSKYEVALVDRETGEIYRSVNLALASTESLVNEIERRDKEEKEKTEKEKCKAEKAEDGDDVILTPKSKLKKE